MQETPDVYGACCQLAVRRVAFHPEDFTLEVSQFFTKHRTMKMYGGVEVSFLNLGTRWI
jgi:hypothetical protein